MGRVILIHGTFDGDESETGERWWQKGGAMRADLEAAGHQVEAFRWSGENSDVARMKAAQALAHRLAETDDEVTLLAHSHGGNVAREALILLKPDERARIRTVSIGTPFLDRVPPFTRNLWGWETLLLVSVFAILIAIQPVSGRSFEEMSGLSDNEILTGFGVIGVSWALLFLWRIVRNRAANYTDVAGLFTPITHTGDEAVAMLQMADRQKIEAATVANSRSTIRLAMMPLVFLAMAGSVVWLLYYFAINWEVAYDEWQGLLVGIPLFAAGTFFAGVILTTFLSFPLSYVAPPVLNGIVQSTIKSSGLGLDSGASYRRVGPSPVAGGKVQTMPSGLEATISDHANAALSGRVGLLREVLTTASQKGIDPMKALDETFTWDELIHTAYFRVPACRAYILEKVGTS
ncbi:alpha/beta fold hydrolase [Parvularcula sp. ZS-1/3]|uniref:Alpha/beta fold hydrolase n=1 Tax=Parvularcula mediterranea TaxID=2732508 RepID=A0A7Y3RLP9_9PROT|nr:alpha/beta fold hydrolase [Parvularcula mediterranea]NNU16413.1 alpha/beta fold hydrolase [Parvularcula mediterranea]